jgi:Transposase zinc-ribbon domain
MVPMTPTPLLNLSALLDDAKCFALIRQHRWPDGVRCPTCGSAGVARHGLSGTVLAGHHQPLRVWVLCLYLMGLNLSNRQIAHELDLSVSDVQAMTEQLRAGLVANTPAVTLEGEVEVDEVYVVAGHKGHPAAVAKKVALGGAAGSRARPAGARWPKRSRRSSA